MRERADKGSAANAELHFRAYRKRNHGLGFSRRSENGRRNQLLPCRVELDQQVKVQDDSSYLPLVRPFLPAFLACSFFACSFAHH